MSIVVAILIVVLIIFLYGKQTEGFYSQESVPFHLPFDLSSNPYNTLCDKNLRSDWRVCNGGGRSYDNYMRHLTKPSWIAKEDIVPVMTPYFDYERFYPSGILTHTTKPTLTLTLFSEKNLSGGGVVFNYKYGIVHFSNHNSRDSSLGTTIPFQTDKDLNTDDVVRIPGYPGKFRVSIQERGYGIGDLPYPYTFQRNVV